MANNLKLEGEHVPGAIFELLVKINALQQATITILCDKLTKSDEESDELYKSIIDEANDITDTIIKDLQKRRGSAL